MQRPGIKFLIALLSVGGFNCFADLIPTATPPTNQIPSSGSGYGAVTTLLNADNSGGGQNNDGLETNCDVISGGNVVSQCSGPFSSLALEDAGMENNAQSLAAAGITDSTVAASEILLIFNINQAGSAKGLYLDALGLALWFNGNLIFSAENTRSDDYSTNFEGIGTAGFGYQLDATEAAAAQTAINTAVAGGATLSSILVTGAFQAGCLDGTTDCANDGAETLFLGAKGSTVVPPVPEPTSIVLLGTALALVGKLMKSRLSA